MAVIKPKRSSVASNVPTTSDLEVGEIAINLADQKLYVRNTSNQVVEIGGSSVDFSALSEAMIPDTTETYDLGSADKRWRDLYLAGNTINLAGATISSDGSGTIEISANGATLPAGSKITTGGTTTGIALQGQAGEVIQSVPIYTKEGGLDTANTNLNFRANTTRVVANFTLSDGSTLTSSSNTLFFL